MASIVSGYIGKMNPGDGTEYSLGSTAYGVCGTAADTAAKTVDMTGFTLMEGATIFVKFTNANTASNPTLSVNGSTAKPIVQYGTTAVGTTNSTTGWQAGAVVCLTYDGTSWVRDQGYNTNNTYTVGSKVLKVASNSGTATQVIGVNENSSDRTLTLSGDDTYITGAVSGSSNAAVVTFSHNDPVADANSELTGSLEGTAGSYAKDTEYTVLTGVKAQRDAKGHVTGITYTAQKVKDTNTNTTYTFADGTNGFTVTPSGGTAQTVTVTPSVSKSDVGLGNVTNHQQVHEVAWDSTNQKITRSKNGAAGDVVQFVAGSNITLTAAAGKLTIASSYTNSRDPGYGKIKAGTASTSASAITANTSTAEASTYNETLTINPGNKWVAVAASNSSTAGSDTFTIGHSTSGVTANTYGNTSQQTPSHGGTFNIPYFTVDAAGHITAASTTTVKLPSDNNTDTLVKQTAKTDNVEYKLLTTVSASPTSGNAAEAGYSTNLAYNPSTNTLSTINASLTGAISVTGNATLSNETYAASLTAGSLLVNGNANFTQIPTSITPASSSNDTSVATTEFVKSSVSGLSGAMHFKGTTTTAMSDGLTTAAVTIGGNSYTPEAGDVVIYSDSEYVWTGSAWERFGRDGSWKTTQSAVDSGTATTNKWASRIQQNANGELTVTMASLDTSGTWSGTATTASKLSNTSKVGDTNKPVYFTANGVPAAISYTIDKSVPSDAVFTDTKNTAGSTDTTSKIYLIGATSQADNLQTYSDSEVYVQSGSLYLVKTQDLSGTANNKPALILGGADTSAHLELDNNEIQAKTNGTSVAQLYLNNDGGLVTVGSGGLAVTSLTASQAVSTDANKKLVSTNLAVSDPTASGTGISYIATISQSAVGKITVTKSTVRTGTTSQTGVVQLTDSTSSTSTTTAATPNSVKSAYDLANGHKYWANVESTSAAAYNKAPEVANIKINGNTSATAASTKNVQLTYDSTLEVLNFVFS